jgi:hypothetical protein
MSHGKVRAAAREHMAQTGEPYAVARRVAQTLAALMEAGTDLGDPLVVATAGAWPEALAEALSRSYPERLERLTAARRAAAAAATPGHYAQPLEVVGRR